MAGQMFYKRKSDGAVVPINPGPQGPQGEPGLGMDLPTADARYVNADGDTMGGVLTVRGAGGAGPGQVILDGENGTTNLHMYADGVQTYRLSTISGRLRVYGSDRGSGELEAYSFYENNLVYQRGHQNFTQADSVVMLIPTAAHQVPRLARTPDPTTGDLGLPGFAGSSTGLRDVSSLLAQPQQGTGQNHLVREGNIVHFKLDLAPGWTSDLALTEPLPVGFRPATVETYRAYYGGSVYVGKNGQIGVGSSSAQAEGVGRLAVSMSWPVIEDWPSSLPGTEVSPPTTWS